MTLELLAPAKDLACGMAAINCGADAVYLGASRFGARENAGNSLADIAALTRHAHAYWAKVYVTLNTLLHDEEIPHAVRLMRQLYEAGIDGLIIQDVGLLECELPPIPLIASTQMHNATPEKVAFLEQVGFRRVILARELSLSQIAAIRARTSVALECFIHGALCVCYSGQCYLSYALGGRSGNRGQCAQPCRKPYTVRDGQGQVLASTHALSLRDLNLTDHLRELVDAGVSSFKIEGRLKDQAYIMNVVSHYRARLDEIMAGDERKASSGKSVIDFTPDPRKTFNRGYTSYFLHGRGDAVASPETPKMVGEPVGAVSSLSRGGFVLDTPTPLNNGDGICFFDTDGALRGTVVNGMHGHTVLPYQSEGITVGTRIFRNHDHAFLTQLAKARAERQIGVALTLRATRRGFAVTATDEDGVTVAVETSAEKTRAEKPEVARAAMEKQLAKMGGTSYYCQGVTVELPTVYFLPVATLNALRRDALEQLTAARAAQRPVSTARFTKTLAPYPEKALDYHGNVLNRYAGVFYRRHGVARITQAAESGVELYGKQVMTTKLCVKYQLGHCPRHGGSPCAEPLSLTDAEGNRLELHSNCAACRMEVWLGERKPSG